MKGMVENPYESPRAKVSSSRSFRVVGLAVVAVAVLAVVAVAIALTYFNEVDDSSYTYGPSEAFKSLRFEDGQIKLKD